MSVFPVTFIVSACLLAIFIIYFARTHAGQRKRGVDHESLLPLEEETPRVVGSKKTAVVRAGQGANRNCTDEPHASDGPNVACDPHSPKQSRNPNDSHSPEQPRSPNDSP